MRSSEPALRAPQKTVTGLGAPPTQHMRLRVKMLEDELEATRKGIISALLMLMELKDIKSGYTVSELAHLAVRVAWGMGVSGDDLRDIEIAATLHDIGKVGVADRVLLQAGELTPEDLRQVRKHPEFGWSILRTVEGLERAGLLILHHQERFDGSGYPAGLAGDEVPLGSRIIAVLDSFDAIATDRPYRRGLGNEEAFRRLRQGAGTQFDPEVVERFVTTASAYFAQDSSDLLYQGGGFETLIV